MRTALPSGTSPDKNNPLIFPVNHFDLLLNASIIISAAIAAIAQIQVPPWVVAYDGEQSS